MKIGYDAVREARRDLIKQVMEMFEDYMKKYSISLDDYHCFRSNFRFLSIRLDNRWKELFMQEFDRKKWGKRIDKKGEEIENGN